MPPHDHVGDMANTALVGDNHGMFHQVGPVGPFDQGTRLVTPRALLAPADDVRLDLDRIEDPGLIAAVHSVYPEAVPVGKVPSIFDVA